MSARHLRVCYTWEGEEKLFAPKPFNISFCLMLTPIFLGKVLCAEPGPPSSADNLVVRGTLVCLEKGSDSKEVPCLGERKSMGLRTATGQVYPLNDDKSTSTLLEEKRLRTREFQLTLKKSGASYEIVKSQFFRDGKLYDFYYFCDVCNITTHTPGLCMCCRQETEYHEKLAD